MDNILVVGAAILGAFLFALAIWAIKSLFSSSSSSSKSSSCTTVNGVTHCNESSRSGSSSSSSSSNSSTSCVTHNGVTTCNEGFQTMRYAPYDKYDRCD